MQFNAEQYYRASLERMTQARGIYDEGKAFALAMYCGGLAVESLLRAFRWTHDPTFQGRHDLTDLFKASRLFEFDDEYGRRRRIPDEQVAHERLKLRSAMNEVTSLWHNNQRFASELRQLAFLKGIRKGQRVKGDLLKKSAHDLIEAAHTVVSRGNSIWESKIRL